MTRKRIVLYVFASMFFSSTYAQTKKTVPVKVSPKASPEYIESGKQLLLKSDCVSCHKEDNKLVGPSYLEIAKKYPANEANYSYLANKIIKGGSGTWGQIPMSPHSQISVNDAEKIAMYILSVKEDL